MSGGCVHFSAAKCTIAGNDENDDQRQRQSDDVGGQDKWGPRCKVKDDSREKRPGDIVRKPQADKDGHVCYYPAPRYGDKAVCKKRKERKAERTLRGECVEI